MHLRLHPDDLPMIERTAPRTSPARPPPSSTTSAAGTVRWLWVEACCKPLAGADGRIHRLLVWSRDITAHRLAEAIVACQTKVLEMIASGALLAETLTTLLQLRDGQGER